VTERVERLRRQTFEAEPAVSAERARRITSFYREQHGRHPPPVLRALAFRELCEQQTLYLGEDELIVGERGPAPKVVPTYPELTCHTLEDLEVLAGREKTRYRVDAEVIAAYRDEVIPYWSGRTMRERIFALVPPAWERAYRAGAFTEFMEQRAPGHTTLDGQIYERGLLDRRTEIAAALAALDFRRDPTALERSEQLQAMDIACQATIRFAERHAALALERAHRTPEARRRRELERIAAVCRRVPAHAPRDLWEAIQTYWFVHLGTIIELNGWDAMNPGRLDQHLLPFYEAGLRDGTLDRDGARELLQCLWIKFNNHPAPPKVGVTAEESGTYNDFTNINLGGLRRDGSDGVNDLSFLMLEVIEELHLLQPGSNVQVSSRTSDRFLRRACEVIRRGYGYPSVFNADMVVAEQVRAGKHVEDARDGGTSGCIETGCFGKEAYLLTGYLSLPKVLELALHDGVDPLSGETVGVATNTGGEFADFDALYRAFEAQLDYLVDLKVGVNQAIERLVARTVPAPFLSCLISDCIPSGRDYYDGGPRYNTTYIQCCGIGTVTDSLSSLRTHVFESGRQTLREVRSALAADFRGHEALRARFATRTPRFGNDDDAADELMRRVFASLVRSIDGRPNTRGGTYHLNMLSTTCHVYFGSKLGASADGRRAGAPISDGTSPSHGADRRGPTAVCRSLAKMDQVMTGGTLLNQRFLPQVLAGEAGLTQLANLIRGYFRLGGHHIQFNVVDDEALRDAQRRPEAYRDLLVRVAGYSDYFVDLARDLQEEIIARTAQGGT
jgi:trans-4-hydroxy-L-proline dehydratase